MAMGLIERVRHLTGDPHRLLEAVPVAAAKKTSQEMPGHPWGRSISRAERMLQRASSRGSRWIEG